MRQLSHLLPRGRLRIFSNQRIYHLGQKPVGQQAFQQVGRKAFDSFRSLQIRHANILNPSSQPQTSHRAERRATAQVTFCLTEVRGRCTVTGGHGKVLSHLLSYSEPGIVLYATFGTTYALIVLLLAACLKRRGTGTRLQPQVCPNRKDATEERKLNVLQGVFTV